VLLQLARVADDALADGLHVRAVIADEHHQQAVLAARLGEVIALAVHAGQIEIAGFPAEIT
jgi:hypothetical protein